MEQKAKRGKLIQRVPVGYVRTSDGRTEKDPGERVHAAIDLVFRKFAEFGTVRRLYFWLAEQRMNLPLLETATRSQLLVWRQSRYHTLLSLIRNPIYAGAYAYGRSKTVVRIEWGRKHVSRAKRQRSENWTVLIPNHHEGYISCGEYQTNQVLVANNAKGKAHVVRGSVKRGAALLSGLLRCGHCGTKLVAQYPSLGMIRYQCGSHILGRDRTCCVMFGGRRGDQPVVEQVLQCLSSLGTQAALGATERTQGSIDERVHRGRLSSEQAQYGVARARRQNYAVDPTNRSEAAELEHRWNSALKAHANLEEEIAILERNDSKQIDTNSRNELLVLGRDLSHLWDHYKSPVEFKKRSACGLEGSHCPLGR